MLYVMTSWEPRRVIETRPSIHQRFLLQSTRETQREVSYFGMILELCPHRQAPWNAPIRWLCYRSPVKLKLLLPTVTCAYARPAPKLTKDEYLQALIPGLIEHVRWKVEQSWLLRRFLYIGDKTRKEEYLALHEPYFRMHFSWYYDDVAEYWQLMPDSEVVIPLHRRKQAQRHMMWTVYAVVMSARAAQISRFDENRPDLDYPVVGFDTIGKAVHAYCQVLDLTWN